MIHKIVIRNYKIFKEFELEFNEDLNVIVGDNEAGKSTLLEAVSLGLTSRFKGQYIGTELTPSLFNKEAADEYVTAIQEGKKPAPPEITIDIFLRSSEKLGYMKGTNNALKEDVPGLRLQISFNEDHSKEYLEYIKDKSQVKVVPSEYYKISWLYFSGSTIPTYKSLPTALSFINAQTIRLKSGADYYLQTIINDSLNDSEKVELARSYRTLKETFNDNPSIVEINKKLNTHKGDISEKELSMSVDTTPKTGWKANLVPHLDEIPFELSGEGEQSSLKILLALTNKIDKAQVVLIEEPENHLSYSTMNNLVRKIKEKCEGKQIIITTHSSYVINKMGLEKLIVLSNQNTVKLTELKPSTEDYFMKLSGYDTLRVVLAKKVILVEGPSDELIVQRAFADKFGSMPLEHGVDVINVRGLSFKRFLEIAVMIKKKVIVVTDNDGNYTKNITEKYKDYFEHDFITICADKSETIPTLEAQISSVNSLESLNEILGTSFTKQEDLVTFMREPSNKTECALKIFESKSNISIPAYIEKAINE